MFIDELIAKASRNDRSSKVGGGSGFALSATSFRHDWHRRY